MKKIIVTLLSLVTIAINVNAQELTQQEVLHHSLFAISATDKSFIAIADSLEQMGFVSQKSKSIDILGITKKVLKNSGLDSEVTKSNPENLIDGMLIHQYEKVTDQDSSSMMVVTFNGAVVVMSYSVSTKNSSLLSSAISRISNLQAMLTYDLSIDKYESKITMDGKTKKYKTHVDFYNTITAIDDSVLGACMEKVSFDSDYRSLSFSYSNFTKKIKKKKEDKNKDFATLTVVSRNNEPIEL